MRALLLAVAAALVPAAPASASIVYARGTAHRSVWIANDDGSGARKLVAEGDAPHISPDGQAVVYTAGESGSRPQLREIPAAGGASQRLLAPVRFGVFAWSSDGRYVAAQTGPLNGAQKLVLIDRSTGTSRTLATGAFYGASFSPDATQLVYSRAPRDALLPVANLAVAADRGRRRAGDHVRRPRPVPAVGAEPHRLRPLPAPRAPRRRPQAQPLADRARRQRPPPAHARQGAVPAQRPDRHRLVGRRHAPARAVRRPGHDVPGDRSTPRPGPSACSAPGRRASTPPRCHPTARPCSARSAARSSAAGRAS